MSDKNDIYKILGVDPNHKSKTSSRGNHYHKSNRFEEIEETDPNAPSGSMFENYANYPREQYGYWQTFRILWIIGIITFLSPIIYYIVQVNYEGHSYSRPVITQAEEPAVVEIEPAAEKPSSSLPEIIYFKGAIDGKYGVHMKVNTVTRRGEYYYDRNGNTRNNMHINLNEIEKTDNGYRFVINEFNPQGQYCGRWVGTYDGRFYEGDGVFLNVERPFTLERCDVYETQF